MALKKSDRYGSLWSGADDLRGGMDASQYKELLPDWRARRDELNAAPLAAEEWGPPNEAADLA